MLFHRIRNNLAYSYLTFTIFAYFIIPVRGGIPFLVTSLAVLLIIYQLCRGEVLKDFSKKEIFRFFISFCRKIKLTMFRPENRQLSCLIVFILVWPLTGLISGNPVRGKLISETWYALGIFCFMLLIIRTSQVHSDFSYKILRLLFILGTCSALASLCLYVSELLALPEGLSVNAIKANRLVPVGRSQHQIMGAGGLAAAFFTGGALYLGNFSKSRIKYIIICGLLLIFLTICLTQSRGPVISLILASAGCFYFDYKKRKPLTMLVIAVFCCLVPLCLVFAEPVIKGIFCEGSNEVLCRPSLRVDVWLELLEQIRQSPVYGYGIGYRVVVNDIVHAHNTFIGTALTRGIPVAIAFYGLIGIALFRATRMNDAIVRIFVSGSLLFALGFMATDLPNPFTVLNSHYFFLWMPVALAFGGSPSLR